MTLKHIAGSYRTPSCVEEPLAHQLCLWCAIVLSTLALVCVYLFVYQ